MSEVIRAAAKKWFYESFDCDLLEKMEKAGLIAQAEGFSISVMADLELDMEAAFDRVTAERDALQILLNESNELCGSLERSMKNHRHELCLVQKRLTAADDQLDGCGDFQQRQIAVIQEFSQQVWLLKSLLKRCQPHLPGYSLALRTDVESTLKVDEVEVFKP